MKTNNTFNYKNIRNLDDLRLERAKLLVDMERKKLHVESGWLKLKHSLSLENITDLTTQKLLGKKFRYFSTIRNLIKTLLN